MEDILQFNYTGSVQTTAAGKAEDLVMAADYLCLPLLSDSLKHSLGNF